MRPAETAETASLTVSDLPDDLPVIGGGTAAVSAGPVPEGSARDLWGTGRGDGLEATIGAALARLYASATTLAEGADRAERLAEVAAEEGLALSDDHVAVDLVAAEGAGPVLSAALDRLGLDGADWVGGQASGLVPVTALEALAGLEGIEQVRPSYAVTDQGSALNQAAEALNADDARNQFGVDGEGLTIGILSDSFDQNGFADSDYDLDVITGDLPPGVLILDDSISSGSDEGRAMAQLVYDIAPGVNFAFHTAFNGLSGFAQGIIDLADAGADIIVDDVRNLAEGFYQDGIIAQAVDEVVARGIPYFASGGNYARDSYESETRFETGTVFGGTAVFHDFDPGAGTDYVQNFTLAPNERIFISLQWDQPLAGNDNGSPGATGDIDLIIFELDENGDSDASMIVEDDSKSELGRDPLIISQFSNTSGSTKEYGLVLRLFDGEAPDVIKWVDLRGGLGDAEYITDSGTSFGHSSAEGAFATGAAFYDDTPAFGTNPPVLQDFSSAGDFPIFFDVAGNRLAEPEDRDRIDGTAPDGGDNTFFGSDINDAGNDPNFFGTSAAAPNAAAVAALMLSRDPDAKPEKIYRVLQETAIDIVERQGPVSLPTGFDDDSGAGLIQADAAVAAVLDAPDILLTQGETDTRLFGNGFEGVTDVDGRLTAAFEGTGEDLLLSFSGFDVDTDQEIEVLLNGDSLGRLSPGVNNGTAPFSVLIEEEDQLSGENLLTFVQRLSPTFLWGVTDLLLDVAPPADVWLTVGQLEDGAFGNLFEDATDADGRVSFGFEGTDDDLSLSFSGFDVDSGEELAIELNGEVLAALPAGRNEGEAGYRVDIPAALQETGANVITFVQLLNPGFKWGVTDVLLDLPPAPDAVLVQGQTETGAFGNLFEGATDDDGRATFEFEGAGADLILTLTGFDVDNGEELALELNGEVLAALPAGVNEGLRDYTVEIRAEDQVEGTNELEVVQLLNPGFKWGVTDLRLDPKPGPDGVLELGITEDGIYGNLFEDATDEDGVVGFTFQGTALDLRLSFEAFDVDTDEEIAVRLNGDTLTFLPRGVNDGLKRYAIAITADDQVEGTNELEFVQSLNPAFRWGVTEVQLIEAPQAAPPEAGPVPLAEAGSDVLDFFEESVWV